jgi:hypothetical protein
MPGKHGGNLYLNVKAINGSGIALNLSGGNGGNGQNS